jgi:3-oxoacyl-[acyl-carrier-protein] synthase II
LTRVAVTGLGAVSPVGNDARTSYAALIGGASGIRKSSLELGDDFVSRLAGEVKGLDIVGALGNKEMRRQSRYTQLALISAREALADAGWSEASYPKERVACVIGVGMGGIEIFEEAVEACLARGPTRVSPYGIPALIPNMGAGLISQLAGARGPSWCTATACASGAHAIGQAMQLLRSGSVDAAICGGAEACITRVALAAFARMGALSSRNHEPEKASRPFDRDRDGFVMAEGAAILVLEREDDAKRRGARVHGIVAGFGSSGDAFHPTQPPADGHGAVQAMTQALADARFVPQQIGYINAHGTGTRYNDAIEATAIRKVFDRHALELAVSSTKGATGHMLGAAGAFEAIVCLLALQEGKLPPTLNLDSPDDDCDLDLVPRVARDRRVTAAMSNSFAFGGQNASLIFTCA